MTIPAVRSSALMRLAAPVVLALALAATAAARPPDPLATLHPGHPRLLATADDWARLRARLETDPLLADFHTGLVAEARALLAEPPAERRMIGRRLLAVSRTLVHRVATLGYAWQTTGERAFADRAAVEMLAAADFPDWNPAHFLDTAEATTALALGYDWCHDALAPEVRARIRAALVEKGLQPGIDRDAPHNGWHRSRNNWIQVCFGGLTLGALALADEEPELARTVLTLAREGIGRGLAPYAPDGVYPEGPTYWAYGTGYQVLMLAALESALGTDWDLAGHPGFLPSAGFVLQATAPSGRFFNFADAREGGGLNPALFWFARRLGDPGLLLFNWRQLPAGKEPETKRFLPFVPLWWPEESAAGTAPALPLRWTGRGANPIGVFRESWTDPTGSYLAFKGGTAEVNHGHMDAGSFILEADGVRWAIDLGLQEYESLESKGLRLFNRAQDSQRWDVYRLGNQGHGTLTLGGARHRANGYAAITHFSGDADDPRAIVDLSPVFAGQATGVRRGFRVLPGRRILIQDELTGLTPGTSVRWQMPTRAEVTVDGGAAALAQDGRTLQVCLLSPTDGAFSAAPAEPSDDGFNAPNPGVTMLAIELTAPAGGTLRIAVMLAPGDAAGPAPKLADLDAWVQPADCVPAP